MSLCGGPWPRAPRSLKKKYGPVNSICKYRNLIFGLDVFYKVYTKISKKLPHENIIQIEPYFSHSLNI